MTPDLLIVGGGLAGCSVAWHLAGDHRVLLLEQGPTLGAEASAQNAGMLRRMGEDPYERALAMRTHVFLEDPGPDWTQPPSRSTGALLGLAHDRDHLTDAVAHLRAWDVPVQACDRPAEMAPALAGSPLRFAWWLPDERVVEPSALVEGFAVGARRRGAELRCGVQVQALLTQGGRVVGVRTDGGDLHADRVLLAAGAWSAGLAARAGLDRPLVPLRRACYRVSPDAPVPGNHPWTWIDDIGVYARPEASSWLVSGCGEQVSVPEPGPGSTGEPDAAQLRRLEDKLRRWFPSLIGLPRVAGWTGLRTFAPDRRPVLGADPELQGLWWAAGLGGFGVSCSVGVGQALAAWMRGGTVPWLHAPSVAPGRPLASRWLIRPEGLVHEGRLVSSRPEGP